MLHELLLSLSGHPSPLLRADGHLDESLGSLLSPSEKALLRKLAHLGTLHNEVRSRAAAINASDPSFVCRAIAASILETQLGRYQDKIIEIEKGILKSDSKLVAAYNNVPLSTIVVEFDEWPQILEWLIGLLDFVQTRDKSNDKETAHKSGARVLDYLTSESRTGYANIEALCVELLKAGEAAWLRQVCSWILYGKLPTYGTSDFLIQAKQGQTGLFKVRYDLAPAIASRATCDSLLFVGRSVYNLNALSSIQSHSVHFQNKPDLRQFLSDNVSSLAALDLPLSSTVLTRMVNDVRLSLARTALQKLLPTKSISRALQVLHDFFLLQRGEFAMALVATSDQYLAARRLKANAADPTRNLQALGGAMIKEAELSSILNKAWTTLVLMQGQTNEDDEDIEDETLDMAREMISLEIPRSQSKAVNEKGSRQAGLFDDILVGTPAVLRLAIPSPLDLFLSLEDVQVYSQANSLLLGIRRAHSHLTGLWKLSVLRRTHPGPIKPVNSATQPKIVADRERARHRNDRMRGIWAAITSTSLSLVELGEYFQGEVIAGSWSALQAWIDKPISTKHDQIETIRDPETLAIIHQRYLLSLSKSLFLNDQLFTRALRLLLGRVDHAVGLIQRLEIVTQTLMAGESTEDSGPEHLQREESALLESLENARHSLGQAVSAILRCLKDLEMAQLESGLSSLTTDITNEFAQIGNQGSDFSPWNNASLSELIMKLEFAGASSTRIATT